MPNLPAVRQMHGHLFTFTTPDGYRVVFDSCAMEPLPYWWWSVRKGHNSWSGDVTDLGLTFGRIASALREMRKAEHGFCAYDSGSMYGNRPMCDAMATHVVVHASHVGRNYTSPVCGRHLGPMQARVYPMGEATYQLR